MCDTLGKNSAAALSAAAATTLKLRDQINETKALTNCRTPFHDIVGLVEDRFASSGGDIAGVVGQQDGNVGFKNDDTRVDKLSNSASDSPTCIPKTDNNTPSSQNRRLLERSDGYKTLLVFGYTNKRWTGMRGRRTRENSRSKTKA